LKILAGVVYGVYSEPRSGLSPAKGSQKTSCFGLSTTQGLIEFKCEGNSKHNWVHGVQNLLQQVDVTDQVGHQLETLKLKCQLVHEYNMAISRMDLHSSLRHDFNRDMNDP
jgi:hypothetical protein